MECYIINFHFKNYILIYIKNASVKKKSLELKFLYNIFVNNSILIIIWISIKYNKRDKKNWKKKQEKKKTREILRFFYSTCNYTLLGSVQIKP